MSPRAAHLIFPLLLWGHLQELEVELLHVRPLEAAGLLLAAVLVDAVLEGAPLAQRAYPASVPLQGVNSKDFLSYSGHFCINFKGQFWAYYSQILGPFWTIFSADSISFLTLLRS